MLADRVTAAIAKADQIIAKYAAGGLEIPSDDLVILKKYESLKLIKILNKRQSIQECVYWPIIEAKELSRFSHSFYLQLIHALCNKYHVKTGIGINSVREYCNKPYEYNMIEPVILPDSHVGKSFVEEECNLLHEQLQR